jgi:glycosyltransferase involved in cell wall biosynthesis
MAKLNIIPTISVVTPTFNSEKTLDKCLGLVRNQNYPQDKIEIILGDGGSTDTTLEIAKKYGAKVVNIPSKKQHAEYNRGVAFNKAKGDYVLVLDHDNYMTSNHYLNDLLHPLLENPSAVASESCYFHYSKKYSLIDRYYALFGTIEPLPFYLGKSDRLMQTQKKWNLLGKAEDKGKYYLVNFESNPRMFPTIGTNGCLMRRRLVLKNSDTRPGHHYPIDVMFDVVKNGHSEFIFVKNSLIHLTGSKGIYAFLKRRMNFMQKYHFEDKTKRRYSVYMKGDEVKLIIFIIYSLTLFKPIYDSVVGYRKIHDLAWFIHPIMCVGTVAIYGFVTVNSTIRQVVK